MDAATRAFQVFALVLCFGFPLRYALKVRSWRQSAEGWYLMLSHIGFSLILCLAVATAFFGQSWPARPAVRLGVYVILCIVFLMPHILLTIRNCRRGP